MTRLAPLGPGLAAVLLAACAATTGSAPGAPGSGTQTPLEPAPAARALPPPPAPPTTPATPEIGAAAKALDAQVHKYLADHPPARRDGYVYASDIATLLLYAARRGDAELYDRLLPVAQSLVSNNPDDPYTAGFVLQRTKQGARPGVSSAAEGLWLARALWSGAAAFDRGDDRVLALTILDGYAKHAYVMQGVWIARHEFDFSTRSFASLSLLPAYQPDFLAQAERQEGRKAWRGLAERSYALLGKTATPSGLMLPLIQPEVGATYPGAGLDAHAPNGIAPLAESCLGAESAAAGEPTLGRALLAFATERARKGHLRAFYSIDDGSAAGDAPLSADGAACLVRLASVQNDAEALAALDPRLLADLQAAARARGALASAGPLLLAAQARGAL